MEKGKVISSSKIDNQPWVYEVVLADDECHVNAKLRPEDEKVIGKPKPNDDVFVLEHKRGQYIIVERNGKVGPSGQQGF